MPDNFKFIKEKIRADDRGRVTIGSALANKQFTVFVNERGQYLLDPIPDRPREGWREAFERMHNEGEDKLNSDYEQISNAADDEEWTW